MIRPSIIVLIIILASVSVTIFFVGKSYYVSSMDEESIIISHTDTDLLVEFGAIASTVAYSDPMQIPFENIVSAYLEKPESPSSETRSPGLSIGGTIKTGTYLSERGTEYWFTKTGEHDIITIELKDEKFDRLVLELENGKEWEEQINKLLERDLEESKSSRMMEKLWTSKPEFSRPESVVYDQHRDIIYVSNINGSPLEKNNMGFISIVSLDGKIINQKWIENLDAPKGMAIFNDTLYVSDIDDLVEIDIKSGKITNRYNAPDSMFLNDVTVDDMGTVFVSDMMTNTIHWLHQNEFKIWLQTPELENPNGLMVQENKLIVGVWGVMNEDFTTDVPGHLKAINLDDKSIISLGNGDPVGNLDGVESDGKGNYYVTDWMAGKLLLVGSDGNSQTLLDLEQGSADHEVIVEQNMIIIPMMQNDVVTAYKIS